MNCYELLDSGNGRKLERFGAFVLDRPCSQAVWQPNLPASRWQQADGKLLREGEKDTQWQFRSKIPTTWNADVVGLKFELSTTDFGHVGIFPEHQFAWKWMQQCLTESGNPKEKNVLNLFAYSGGATLAAAKTGASVCHLDASPKMVDWARRNATLNGMGEAPIRWIVDDAIKFLQREIRRGRRYDGIILDPPSYGRGSKKEVFKIDDHLRPLLELCCEILTDKPLFLFLSCHTPGYTPTVLTHIVSQILGRKDGIFEAGEMLLPGENGVFAIPNGAYCGWKRKC